MPIVLSRNHGGIALNNAFFDRPSPRPRIIISEQGHRRDLIRAMASDAGSIQNWCHFFCERDLRLGRRRLLRGRAGGSYCESRYGGRQSQPGSPEKPDEQRVSAHRTPPRSAENRKKKLWT